MTLEEAFIQCLKDGVHPGPTEINERRGRGRRNTMGDSSERLRLMYDFGVPYQRDGAYGKKGEIPYPPSIWGPRRKLPGWRKV